MLGLFCMHIPHAEFRSSIPQVVLVLPALPYMRVLPTFDDVPAFSSLFFSRLRDPLPMLVALLWSDPGCQSPSHITVFRAWAGLRSAEFRVAKESTLRDKARADAGNQSSEASSRASGPGWPFLDHLSPRTWGLQPALYLDDGGSSVACDVLWTPSVIPLAPCFFH